MSLNIDKLTPIVVNDPRMIQEPKTFPVLRGGQDVLYKQFTTTSVSNSSINFSCPPPSQEVIVDRKVHLSVPVRLTLTATGLDPGVLLLNPNQCCIRSYPLQKALDTVQMTINNQSMSINISDTLSAMEHFNMDRETKATSYSKCPTYGTHQSQAFSDLFGATRSPMSLYGDGLDDLGPAAFPFTIVSQTNDGAGAGVSTAVSVVDFVSIEPLFLSPLSWASFDESEAGFMGVKTFDMTLNFLNQAANRMIAIDNVSAGVSFTPATWTGASQFSNFSPAFSYPNNQPVLLFQYLTPQMSDKVNRIDKPLNYNFFNVERYPTTLTAIAAGASRSASSNNIQLNSIPSKMYIFIRNDNNTLLANPFLPDTFCAINSLSIQWGNRNGVLASASQSQLYDLAVKNGCKLSWQAWSGLKLNRPALASGGFGTTAQQYSGTGSIVALDTLDLGLEELDAPGKIAQLMVQVTVNFTNVSDATVNPTLYFVAVSQGVFSLYNGQASTLVGVLTSQDILNARQQTQSLNLSYAEVRRINGGNFLSSLASGLSNVWKFLKPALKVATPLLAQQPGSIGQVASALNPVVQGLGGGMKVPRRRLKDRAK